MHDPSRNDPIIEQPEPVTLLLPVLQETLKSAGVTDFDRDELITRLMSGRPKVVVVSGSQDHPAQVYDHAISPRAIRGIWERGGLPFALQEPAVCDGVAQGHFGMTFSLVSRNLTTSMLVSMVLAHGYDAALVLTSCDKRPVGDVGALIEVDRYRAAVGRPPFHAVFIPANVMAERRLPRDVARELEALRPRVPEAYAAEIDQLLLHKLKCNTYAMFKKLLDNLRDTGALEAPRRDILVREIAKVTCQGGGTCAFYGTGNSDKMVLAGLGLVPRGMEALAAPAGDDHVSRALDPLFAMSTARDPDRSVAALCRANLRNAVRVWAGTGGSMNWALHFPFLAGLMGLRMVPADLAAVSARTPLVFEINPVKDKSYFTLAQELQDGTSSGIDTVMGVLEGTCGIDPAPTVDGTWAERTAGARPANDRIVFRAPRRPRSGIVELTGLVASAAVKLAGMNEHDLDRFDQKAYLSVVYLGEIEAQGELLQGGAHVLDRLEGAVETSRLIRLARFNGADAGTVAAWEGRDPGEVLTAMREGGWLRIAVVILGEGPRATGIPEMFYPSEYVNRDVILSRIACLITDGRFSGATYGPCIGHASPEAYAGGALGGVMTGDVVHLDFTRGRLDVVDLEAAPADDPRQAPVMDPADISGRPILAERIVTLAGRRVRIPFSVRSLLDTLAPVTEGAVPAGLEYHESWAALDPES